MGSSMVVGKIGFPSDLPWVHVAAGRIFSVCFNSFQFYEKDKHNILCKEVTSKVAHYKEANRNSSTQGSEVTLPPMQSHFHMPPASGFLLPWPPLPPTSFFFLLQIHSEIQFQDPIATVSLKEHAPNHLLAQRVCQSTQLPHHCIRISFPMSSQKLSWFLICVSSNSHSNGCIVIFHCTFKFISPRQVTLGSFFSYIY